ncbi:hypothetical protein HK105_203116 [Polyrhizophydium stewartii]|uniref:LITAF domain-containing protein n=1 Tax=Polyrhizophydium stewartii TaxID=2732419 RepID=A0ABR4ND44_9FUNG
MLAGVPVVAGQPTVVPIMVTTMQFGRKPQNVFCPTCRNQVMTTTTTNSGIAVWLSVGGCCLLTGCCCFWVPLVIDDLKDVEHSCPVCKSLLGQYKVIS